MERMMTYVAIMGVVLMAGGCASRDFKVYKGGSNFYITSDCSERERILCNSHDINNIMKDSKLPDLLQKELKVCICAPGQAHKSLLDTFNGMTHEQHSAIKAAFRKNGYEINKPVDT
jgi:hypothetical protein